MGIVMKKGLFHMRLVVGKPFLRVSDQLRLKPVYSATETS